MIWTTDRHQNSFEACIERNSHIKATGSQICVKSGSHLSIIGARTVKQGIYHTDYPQFWSDLWMLLLSGAFFSVYINWYINLYVVKKCNNFAENFRHHHIQLLTYVTRHLGFVDHRISHSTQVCLEMSVPFTFCVLLCDRQHITLYSMCLNVRYEV